MSETLRRENGVPINNQNPLQVNDVSQAMDKESITGETVTLITGAAGFTGVVSLDKKPISNLDGDRVGSFWRTPWNKVCSSEQEQGIKVVAVTETATAADVTIESGVLDLEELFETPSGNLEYIIELTDESGDTLYGWVKGVAETGSSYVLSIFSEMAGSTQSWVGTLSAFTFSEKTQFAIYRSQTSIAWTTGTALTKEVPLPSDIRKLGEFLDGLSNGDYAVDYERGTIYYKKATTGTSDTIAYTVLTGRSVSISGGTSSGLYAEDTAHVSGDLGRMPLGVRTDTPAALSGTTGDYTPLQTDNLGALRVTGSASSTTATYRATTTGRGDGTAVYASGTTLTVAGTPFTLASEDLVYIKEVDATGNTANVWVNGSGGVHMEISGGTLTRSGGTDFSANGVYELGYNGQDKGYDASNTANRNEVINRDKDDQPYDTLLALTNIAANTTAYGYIDLEGYKNCELQIETSGTTPTDVLTLTLEGSSQNDGTAAASCTYQDVTQDEIGVASVVDQDDWWRLIDIGYKYLRIKYNTSNTGGSDADLTVFIKKWS